VLVEGETTEIELTLRNDGTEIWLPGESLVNQRKLQNWQPPGLPASVPPGRRLPSPGRPPLCKWGCSCQWDIVRGSQYLPTAQL
jgi:hypothetical protein